MVHLFDRVYLEITPYLDIHHDRIVISKEFNNRQTPGKVLFQYDSFESLLSSMSFSNFLETVYFHSTLHNRKIVIYCDDISKIHVWFCKHIFPNMNLNSYLDLLKIIDYHRQVFKKPKFFNIDRSSELWDVAINPLEIEKIKNLNLSFSYEFLFAEYLSGIQDHENVFLKKFHHFLREWYSECFTDNREMVLINLFNHKFQEQLSFSINDFNITDKNLLKNIPSLKYYSDEEIWFKDGIEKINLLGLPKEKSQGLVELILFVYKNCEGMETDRSSFGLYKWIECATRDEMTKQELDEVVDYLLKNTFDTSGVPRKKFDKINFALILYFMNCKRNKQIEKLLSYRLL